MIQFPKNRISFYITLLSITASLLIDVSCAKRKIKRQPAFSPQETAAEKKISSLPITLTPTKSPVFPDDLHTKVDLKVCKEKQALRMAVDASSEADYAEAKICFSSQEPCRTEQFVGEPIPITSQKKGTVDIQVRACVYPKNSVFPEKSCGNWSQHSTSLEPPPHSFQGNIGRLRELQNKVDVICSTMRSDMEKYQQSAPGEDEQFAIATQNFLNNIEPLACRALLLNQGMEAFETQAHYAQEAQQAPTVAAATSKKERNKADERPSSESSEPGHRISLLQGAESLVFISLGTYGALYSGYKIYQNIKNYKADEIANWEKTLLETRQKLGWMETEAVLWRVQRLKTLRFALLQQLVVQKKITLEQLREYTQLDDVFRDYPALLESKVSVADIQKEYHEGLRSHDRLLKEGGRVEYDFAEGAFGGIIEREGVYGIYEHFKYSSRMGAYPAYEIKVTTPAAFSEELRRKLSERNTLDQMKMIETDPAFDAYRDEIQIEEKVAPWLTKNVPARVGIAQNVLDRIKRLKSIPPPSADDIGRMIDEIKGLIRSEGMNPRYRTAEVLFSEGLDRIRQDLINTRFSRSKVEEGLEDLRKVARDLGQVTMRQANTEIADANGIIREIATRSGMELDVTGHPKNPFPLHEWGELTPEDLKARETFQEAEMGRVRNQITETSWTKKATEGFSQKYWMMAAAIFAGIAVSSIVEIALVEDEKSRFLASFDNLYQRAKKLRNEYISIQKEIDQACTP